ncbi:MAG TPA: hypothetical protein VEX38_10220 [Fimbriimonadaceae bacterium]|nr:hypothetical protein [Fimbriimonadaceae bacterium]
MFYWMKPRQWALVALVGGIWLLVWGLAGMKAGVVEEGHLRLTGAEALVLNTLRCAGGIGLLFLGGLTLFSSGRST